MRTVNIMKPFVFVLVTVAMFNGCVALNSVNVSLLGGPSEGLKERTVIEAKKFWTSDKILMIDIAGVIEWRSAGGMFGGSKPGMVESVRAVLDLARHDEDIKGLILRIDSPGGGITSTDVIYNEIIKYREDTGVKVVAALMQVAASGGYYIACASDEIIAHPTALTGSIGVITSSINIEGLMNKIGVEHVAIKSGDKKDMGSLFRPLTQEELDIFNDMIQDYQSRFVEVVDKGRDSLDIDEVRRLADGRIYTASQAKNEGLIDDVGYLEDALDAVKKLADIEDAALVVYTSRKDVIFNIYSPTASATHNIFSNASLDQQILGYVKGSLSSGRIPMSYLWAGGLGLGTE